MRRQARRRRTELDPALRERASGLICQRIARSRAFRDARHIGLYLPVNGEVDTFPLLEQAAAAGKRLCLPIVPGRYPHAMEFGLLEPDTVMESGAFGILQPRRRLATVIAARDLDLVIVPLVAFDPAGNRLGMGAGYYDRCFGFLRHRRHWIRPRLLGVAYESQRAESIPSDPWDVPMWCIATEAASYPAARDL